MTDEEMYAEALKQVQAAKASAKLKRDSRFWRGWEKFVSWITFGKSPNTNQWLTTTMGKTIWLCDGFDSLDPRTKADTLIHELEHVRQYAKMTIPGFLFVYIFVFLPVGLAYGRYWLEREAYAKGYKIQLEGLSGGIRATAANWLADEFAAHMAGGVYGWAWPFKRRAKSWMVAKLT